MILAICLPLVLILDLVRIGGASGIADAASVPDTHLMLGGTWSTGLIVSTFIAFLLGEALTPPYAQRAFAAPDSGSARKGYTLAGAFVVFAFVMTSATGLVAPVLYPNVAENQAFLTVVQRMLPFGLSGLALAALLAVVMSTCDSFLNSTAVVFMQDIYQRFVNPKVEDVTKLRLERTVALVTGVAAIVFVLSAPSVINALMYSYYIWAPTVIIPFALAVLFGFRSRIAALSSMIGGGATALAWLAIGEPFGVTGLMAGVLASMFVFVVAHNAFDRRMTHAERSH